MSRQERCLRWLLRILGTSALVAVFAVVMPYSWMNAIHQQLGMGRLPSEPIVGYLARSTSAFYAMLGGLMWVVSSDVRQNHQVLCFLGSAIILFGLALLGVDFAEGMPRFWTLWEGPLNIAIGIAVLWLNSPSR